MPNYVYQIGKKIAKEQGIQVHDMKLRVGGFYPVSIINGTSLHHCVVEVTANGLYPTNFHGCYQKEDCKWIGQELGIDFPFKEKESYL